MNLIIYLRILSKETFCPSYEPSKSLYSTRILMSTNFLHNLKTQRFKESNTCHNTKTNAKVIPVYTNTFRTLILLTHY